ncbi:MAG: nickel-dependent hydrogenase, b-type cytochrome subunit/YceI-like family protein [Hyphomonas sp. BRH_c22]|uniref:cytochrome b/b6 domain-containing protein n=1 Tax=Hyphomonas sp. BRH_c22 TaxID=1629710 RepID=UPI0005F26382|nr:cytochrome b/b6 domain-containing protein [Hyphomonas sp. BRH_c22]KJS39932.1 MAG: nickel-dependent hydrogenase, b-type cytochrome subunit/YceI-like family protein [Hyphomonas sp. BRH_c22]
MFKHSTSRYTAVAIALHWAIAALIIFMIWLGWNMEENETRYQLHKSIGITILLLTVARVVWRMLNPPPALPADMKPLEKTASHYVHVGLYALMILMPLLGWVLVSVSKFQVPTVLFGTVSWPNLPFLSGLRGNELVHAIIETLHSKGAWVIIALLALHVAGALKHEFSAEEGVLKRMIPGLFGKTQPPAAPARGFFIAFGSAALLFALIAAGPVLAQSGGVSGKSAPPPPEPEAAVATSETAAAEPNWTVDYTKSEIRFSGTHEGNAFSGTFKDWTADVAFFPDAVETSDVRVQVQTGTATTGKKLYNDSLRAPEWFDVSNHPVATVHLTDFARTDTGYTATASMRLKNQTVTTPLTFTLDIKGDVATLSGEARFDRKVLNIGQISDPNAEWVSDEVTVTVTGEATRK